MVTLFSRCSFVVAVCLFMLLILVVAVREFGTISSPAGFGCLFINICRCVCRPFFVVALLVFLFFLFYFFIFIKKK